MKYIIYLLFLILTVESTLAQSEDAPKYSNKNKSSLGLGIGLTYGSIGGRFVHNPAENFGLFLGLGYNVVGVGYNAGLMYYIPSKTRTQAYFSGMVGTNAIIKVEDASQFDKSYFGASTGFGVVLKSRANPGSYWDFGIIAPIRSSSFNDDWDDIKNNPGIEIQNDPLPVLINIGYNFKLN